MPSREASFLALSHPIGILANMIIKASLAYPLITVHGLRSAGSVRPVRGHASVRPYYSRHFPNCHNWLPGDDAKRKRRSFTTQRGRGRGRGRDQLACRVRLCIYDCGVRREGEKMELRHAARTRRHSKCERPDQRTNERKAKEMSQPARKAIIRYVQYVVEQMPPKATR